MIEFRVLAMKVEIDDMHAIFLLKKNVRTDIIQRILKYSPIIVPELLKEQKVAITLVEQGYKSTRERQDYKTRLEITYRGGVPINIGKAKNNYNKDRKLRYQKIEKKLDLMNPKDLLEYI